MLRSSRIPPLLSRITGDGIHTAILITTDGELLGSVCTKNEPSNPSGKKKGKPSSLSSESSSSRNISNPSSSSTASTSSLSSLSSLSSRPLDIESTAALVAEVMSDYRRAGHELLLLNFSNNNNNRRREGRLNNSNRDNQDSFNSVIDPNASSEQEREGTDQHSQVLRDSGPVLSCLLLEMEIGLIGVASAGPECLIIAIGDHNDKLQKIEHGLMRARLMAVAGYVRDAFSQLQGT